MKSFFFGVTGFTVYSVGGGSSSHPNLLDNPELMTRIGQDAREYMWRNFLITRNLGNYLALTNYLG